MHVIIYKNNSPKNKLHKNLTNNTSFMCNMLDSNSVLDPIITLNSNNNLSDFNYCYIPDFNRYYFITDITIIRKNLWKFTLHVDVLGSYENEILLQNAIVEDSSNNYNNYLESKHFIVNAKNTTSIINFPNGLNENGEYILITCGGV